MFHRICSTHFTWWRHQWEHFPHNWPFVRGIHRSPANSPHKGQWRGALMFTLICARIDGWVNNREAGDLRRYRPHYDVIVMDDPSRCFPACVQHISAILNGTRIWLWCHYETCQWHITDWVSSIGGNKPNQPLTHWGRDKLPPFRRRHFQVHFLEWKCLNSD